MRFALSFLSLCSMAFAEAPNAFEQCVHVTGQAYTQARGEFLSAPDRELLKREMESELWMHRLTAVILNSWLNNDRYYQDLLQNGFEPATVRPEASFLMFEILLKSEEKQYFQPAIAAIASLAGRGMPVQSEYIVEAIRDANVSPQQQAVAAHLLSALPSTTVDWPFDELIDVTLSVVEKSLRHQARMEPQGDAIGKAIGEAIRSGLPAEQIESLAQQMQNTPDAEDLQSLNESFDCLLLVLSQRSNSLSRDKRNAVMDHVAHRLAEHGEAGEQFTVAFARLLGGSHATLIVARRLAKFTKRMARTEQKSNDSTAEEFAVGMVNSFGQIFNDDECVNLIRILAHLEATMYLNAFARSQAGNSYLRTTALRECGDLPFNQDTFETLMLVARDRKRDEHERWVAISVLHSLVRKTAKAENELQIRKKILNGFRYLQNEGLGDAKLDKEVKRHVDELQE